ncbi:hypothetical protein HYPSUDRAFT_32426 [Hypholoma sublateritium FD-334 SS-4]|uniref:Uncharacterized protein n=1 Tax=Hypholoma sublateritium (strain FD-334 SS-4) TaxID=945553 RepID=A0A0D2PHC9_HYPSF|nr:hypothetical protein HYPSUDRAFT_32426 [Hypholoma sublateritium FD-334 SS-4]
MFDVDVTGDAVATQAFEERAKSVRWDHRRVLQEVCPTAIWARRDAGAALEYIPLLRQMVAADDEEAREMQKKRSAGRNTRNSLRSGYVRMIEITEEGRRVLDACGLVCS